MGGGGTLRTLSRTVATTAAANSTVANTPTHPPQKPLSPSSSSSDAAFSSNTNNNSNLPISSSMNLPVSANSRRFPPFGYTIPVEDFDWVSVDGSGDDCDVPSVDEVQDAVFALQQVFDEDRILCPTDMISSVSSSGSEIDWMEPPLHLCNARMLQPYLHDRFFDAFHLLQTEPAIQRMVISLSTDRAVWNAVMNNEVVRELTGKAEYDPESSDETSGDSNPAANFLKWVLDSSKAKIVDVIEKVTRLVVDLFKIDNGDEEKAAAVDPGPLMETLQLTVLLSVVVLLVVAVTRATRV